MQVKAPYNVNKLTSKVAQEAYANLDVLKANIEAVLEEKALLQAALKAKSCVRAHTSLKTNLLIHTSNPRFKRGRDQGQAVRQSVAGARVQSVVQIALANTD